MIPREFLEDKLYPSIFECIDRVFPELHFQRKGDSWYSPRKLDGTEPKSPRLDKTVIKGRKTKTRAYEQGGESIDLISLYMKLNGMSFPDSVKAISGLLGIDVPLTPEDSKKWEEYREKQEQIFSSCERQRKSLFSPDGEKVLNYLKNFRGWTDEEIKKSGLGYISPQEAKLLEERTSIGIPYRIEDYPLSIPYYSKGNIIGFKFRSISPEVPKGGRYKNTTSLNGIMNTNPFGLSPINVKGRTEDQREIIIVEGELDCIHTQVKGIENVIATTGNGINEENVSILKKNGIDKAILLLDNDSPGEGFTESSIKTLQKGGITTFVATLPEGYKDPDDFLKEHTGEELKTILKNPLYGYTFLYTKLLDSFDLSSLSMIEFDGLCDKVITLVNDIPDELQRQQIIADFGAISKKGIEGIEKIIRAKADRLRTLANEKRIKEITLQKTEEAKNLILKGNIQEARRTLKDLESTITEIETRDKYSSLLVDDTDELWKKFKEEEISFDSRIELDKNDIKYLLSFPSGAVSVIGAPTNHGKSKVLQSLALDALEDNKEGTVLYLTYEETRESVVTQFLNGYANLTLTKTYKSRNRGNLQTLKEYLKTGETKFIKRENLESFYKKEQEFKRILHSQRLKIVQPEDNYLHTLLNLLNFATKNLKIRAVFIDYIQELYIDSKRAYVRTDELKEIMVEISRLAESARIPIIVACQLKQDTESPLSLTNDEIADSKWIAYKASEVILFWSNKENCRGKSWKTLNNDVKTELGLSLGNVKDIEKDGELYFIITKSRNIPTGAVARLHINGNTGRVKGNSDPSTDRARIETDSPSFDNFFPDDSTPTKPEIKLPF